MQVSIWFWVGFNLFILGLLALDLGVFHRQAHAIKVREAAMWSGVWISIALLFNLGIYIFAGPEPALSYLTGYVIEKALSVDNIFVMVVIFGYFKVDPKYQHRVLFWGIIGALAMRGAFIALGSMLIARFHWVIFLFGGLLVITGLKLAFREEKPFDGNSLVLRLARRLIPVTPEYHGKSFMIKREGRVLATPLLLVLILVEVTDLIFAVDSIPAIFAVTTDPFLVYTSNVFAILGLRSLYFMLAGVVHRFHFLKYGLAFILVFVGVKMLIDDFYRIPIGISLCVIAVALAASVVVSLLTSDPNADAADPSDAVVPAAEPTAPGPDVLPKTGT